MLPHPLQMTSYYCLDAPSALHDPLRRHFTDMSDSTFERYFALMYSVYSLPNIVLPLAGGFLTDRLGYRLMNLIFGAFLILGHSIFALGVGNHSIATVLAGRVIYGFGGECIVVGLSSLLAEWFRGANEFAMVMGIKLALGRLGSVLNNIGSRALYQDDGIEFALWFGVILLVVAFGCAIVVFVLDKWAENKIIESEQRLSDYRAAHPDLLENADVNGADGVESPRSPTAAAAAAKEMRFGEILSFGRLYWLLSVSCVVVYGCIIPFNNVASTLIIERYICHGKCDGKERQDSAETKASFVMGIPFIMTACLAPFMGFLVDRFGGNAALLVGSALTLFMLHLSMALSDDFALLVTMLVFLGLAYSVYAASLWPSVPATIEKHQVGTGYGLMTSLQNVGLTTFPLAIAGIRNEAGDYSGVEIFFACLAALGSAFAFYTYWYDQSHQKGLLNMSAAERNAELELRARAVGRVAADADEELFGSDEESSGVRSRRGGGLLGDRASDE
jgi:MFS family permease